MKRSSRTSRTRLLARQRFRQLFCETLEKRYVLAVPGVPHVEINGGVLEVDGETLRNDIYIHTWNDAGTLRVLVEDQGGIADPTATPPISGITTIQRQEAASSITSIIVRLDGITNDVTNTSGGDDRYWHDLTGYANLASLNVRGQGGNDIIVADGNIKAGVNITLDGGAGDDGLYGGQYPETINGAAGRDTIYGGRTGDGAGDTDTINGGTGDDWLYGMEGVDTISGGDDNDMIYGGDGNDIIDGGNGRDTVYGGDGDDTIQGGADPDFLYGQTATTKNTIQGGAGDDYMNGLPGDDYAGGGGNDIFQKNNGLTARADQDDEVDWHPAVAGLAAMDVGGNAVTKVVKRPGAVLVIAATGVVDKGGLDGMVEVTSVPFYRDQDGDGVFTWEGDTGLGSLTKQADGTTWKGNVDISGYAVGNYTFFAFAVDKEAWWGAWDKATVEVVAAPIAMADAYSGFGSSISIPAAGVLSNDSDEDSISLTAVKYSDPQNGSVTLNSNGSFTYTPNSPSVTSDSFQYRAFDGENYSDPATVTITITNPPPNAINDFYSMYAGQTLTVSSPGVLNNDTYADSAQYIAGSGPASGTLTFNSNGSFTYSPVSSFYGAASFQYIAVSASGQQSSAATVTINVISPAPVASGDSYMTYRNFTLNVSQPGVLQNDSNANAAQYVTGTGPAHGSLTFNSSGSFTYVPATNYTGSDSFQYIAQNSATGQQSAAATVTIQVVQMLTLDQPQQTNPTAPDVTLADIGPLYREAIRRWHEAGVGGYTIDAALASVVFVIADIPGSGLAGTAEDGTIVIDVNGAGHGWFIDSTPRTDREFQLVVAPSERKSVGSSPATDRADLLTAIMHEVGHLFGLPHALDSEIHNLMQDTIGLGTRRVPTVEDAALAELFFHDWEQNRRK